MDEKRKTEVSKKIGSRIFELRKSKKLSREKFAELCDISSQHVYYMENGDFLPGCITLIDICNKFSISPSQLLMDSLDINTNILNETLQQDFLKLSKDDRIFIQELVANTMKLLINKNKK